MPDVLKFNSDEVDTLKGELETRQKLLEKTGFRKDVRLFKDLYFNNDEQRLLRAEQDKILKQHHEFIVQHQRILEKKDQKEQRSTSRECKQGRLRQQLEKRILDQYRHSLPLLGPATSTSHSRPR